MGMWSLKGPWEALRDSPTTVYDGGGGGPKASMSSCADPGTDELGKIMLQPGFQRLWYSLTLLLRQAAGLQSQIWTAEQFLDGLK